VDSEALAALRRQPELADVVSNQEDNGLAAYITIDRDSAARLGISVGTVDNALYDAFGSASCPRSSLVESVSRHHGGGSAYYRPWTWRSPTEVPGRRSRRHVMDGERVHGPIVGRIRLHDDAILIRLSEDRGHDALAEGVVQRVVDGAT